MDEARARLRINLAQGEFEVEGSEAFVSAYVERFNALFASFDSKRMPPGPEVPAAAAPAPAPQRDSVAANGPSHIGEWLEHLPRSATDVDRILIAGYFTQRRSSDQTFGTGEANSLLTAQGIKVGNPSQCVKQNLIAKRVFAHQKRYRVSQTGLEHIRHLLGAAFTG